MRTVLHLLNTNTYSGAENVAITMICAMKRLYPHYRLVYVSPDGPIRDRLDSEGVEFEPIEKISRGEIRRVIKKYHPEVIHAHDFTASIVSAYASFGVPVISHIHNNPPWLGRLCVKSVAYLLSSETNLKQFAQGCIKFIVRSIFFGNDIFGLSGKF